MSGRGEARAEENLDKILPTLDTPSKKSSLELAILCSLYFAEIVCAS
jgi:hypothetical protein